MGSRICSVRYGLVGPFEIESLDERLAHARNPEFVATGIDKPALRARRRFVGQCLALDAAILDRRKIITRRPYPCGKFFAEQVAPCGEALERNVAIAIKLEAHGIEVVASSRDRQLGSPPILYPLVFDVAVDLELSDLVRPGSQGNIKRRFLEPPGRVIGLGKDRQPRDIEPNVASALFGERYHER